MRSFVVVGVCGADESVLGKVACLTEFLKLIGVVVNVRMHIGSCFLGCLQYFLAVFVGAYIEKDVITLKAQRARKRISLHKFKCIADVRVGIHVRERRREVA